jgi:hypothetical protein
MSSSIPISILMDNLLELTEYFDLVLSKPVNATIFDDAGRVNILNGSAPLTVAKQQSFMAKEISSSFSATVFPNPTADEFTIEMTGAQNEKVEVAVYDLFSRLVYSKKGETNETFNFGDKFPYGFYIIELRKGNEKIVLKVIKE